MVAQAFPRDRNALVELGVRIVRARGGWPLELVRPELVPVDLLVLVRLHGLDRLGAVLLPRLLLDLLHLLDFVDFIDLLEERIPLQLLLQRLLELEGRHL